MPEIALCAGSAGISSLPDQLDVGLSVVVTADAADGLGFETLGTAAFEGSILAGEELAKGSDTQLI